ncbi:unnamed protein product [Mycena citricolor]|uniref:Uncharacterized protein n=1 Tax=Mycena citricolor TaxID=2018698 RepID=A0AAD2GUY6_9AGAR|nr:unnamed protein product [Mycena citricolor]
MGGARECMGLKLTDYIHRASRMQTRARFTSRSTFCADRTPSKPIDRLSGTVSMTKTGRMGHGSRGVGRASGRSTARADGARSNVIDYDVSSMRLSSGNGEGLGFRSEGWSAGPQLDLVTTVTSACAIIALLIHLTRQPRPATNRCGVDGLGS